MLYSIPAVPQADFGDCVFMRVHARRRAPLREKPALTAA
jgi:hypothetical protein